MESKEDIIARIGRSPDKGDSLVYAHTSPSNCRLLEYYRELYQEHLRGV